MTVSQLHAALALAISDGHGARSMWIKQEDGELKVANKFEVIVGDVVYYPSVVQEDTFGVIEAPQV